jgi:hypothetical protein
VRLSFLHRGSDSLGRRDQTAGDGTFAVARLAAQRSALAATSPRISRVADQPARTVVAVTAALYEPSGYRSGWSGLKMARRQRIWARALGIVHVIDERCLLAASVPLHLRHDERAWFIVATVSILVAQLCT